MFDENERGSSEPSKVRPDVKSSQLVSLIEKRIEELFSVLDPILKDREETESDEPKERNESCLIKDLEHIRDSLGSLLTRISL